MNAPDREALRPFDARMLSVGDGHWIYVEEVGKPGGEPAIFLHGGPGSGSQHMHRRLFDPARHHAFLFDQRGTGRSHPYLSCTANTTDHLIADIEAIREHYRIQKWLVVGGSWGSTLGLAYAEKLPERVIGLVLRAIFLGTAREVAWAFIDGPKIFRPELFEDFVNWLPEAERADPLAAYIKRLTDPDPKVHTPAAHIWNAYERILSELSPTNPRLSHETPKEGRVPPTPILEAHYIRNNFFLGNHQIITNAHRLKGIPGTLVQGRYDLLCPPENAQKLAKAWPDAHLQIIETAGHAMTEAGVMDAMREAIAKGGRS